MSELSPRRGFAFRARTSRAAKTLLTLAILSAVVCAAQLALWPSAEQGGYVLLLLLFAPVMAAVVVIVVLIPSIVVLRRDPGAVSKWALGLALAVVVVLCIEFVVLASNFLDGLRH